MATSTRIASGSLTIADAQRDVRTTFIGGFAGQAVAGCIWAASAGLGTWSSHRAAILTLAVGGVFIFPVSQLVLRLMGRPASLPKGHPMNALAMQVAFLVLVGLPLVAAATPHRVSWFYPAFMLVVGAHYLPFVFLYGMRMFAVLAALLIGAGVLIGLWMPSALALGGWVTAGLLLVFALIGRSVAAHSL